MGSWRWGYPNFVVSAYFRGLSSPTVAHFGLPVWSHRLRSWGEIGPVGSPKPWGPSSTTACSNCGHKPPTFSPAALNVLYIATHLVGWKWALFKFSFPSKKWLHYGSRGHCTIAAVLVVTLKQPLSLSRCQSLRKACLIEFYFFLQSNYWRLNVWEMFCNFDNISL